MEPIPLVGTDTTHPNNQKSEFPQIEYSTAAQEFINFRRRRLISTRDTRDMSRDEFDGMIFLRWYDVQKKADDQYIAPRKNAQDTSINAGSIRDKDTSLVEYAMKYDFEPVAQVYDDSDEMMEELAETGEDLVRKSKLLEEYKSKAKLIYRSMVAFGTALVEDQWVERWVIQKTLKKGYMGSNKAEWEQKLIKQYDGCQAKLWDLRKCYFGDIRKFFMNGPQGQPFFFTVEYESYDVVKQWFGNWDNWKFVPNTLVLTPEAQAAQTYTSGWTLRPVTQNFVEIVRYYDPVANEFAITLNGVDMLPIMDKKTTVNGVEKTLVSGFPLTEVSPSGAIPFAKFDLEPMHDFVYAKSQPSKMRVWGDIENMVIKLILGMFKQKAKPTMGNKSGRNFGPEVTDPATVINDIRDGDLFPILPNFQGAAANDFSFYKMVKDELGRNSVDDNFQGIEGSDQDPKKKTATQEMNERGAMSLKVAALFDGIIAGENQLNWLRTYNIARHWTKPVDQQIDVFKKGIIDKYRTVTLPTTIDGGQKAVKKIVFTKDTGTKNSQDVHQEEVNAVRDGNGQEVRITYLHPEQFAQMKMSWFYTCVPVPNGTDPLSYMLFAKQIVDAQTFFGPDSLNVKKLKHRFAALTGNDFDTWFLSEQELQQKQQATATANAGAQGEIPGKKVAGQPTSAGASSPSIPGNRMGAIVS